jgi:hypothetical protein
MWRPFSPSIRMTPNTYAPRPAQLRLLSTSYGLVDFIGGQVERKRHLGNDIVVIVFLDSGTFTPSMIKTKFNRTTFLELLLLLLFYIHNLLHFLTIKIFFRYLCGGGRGSGRNDGRDHFVQRSGFGSANEVLPTFFKQIF